MSHYRFSLPPPGEHRVSAQEESVWPQTLAEPAWPGAGLLASKATLGSWLGATLLLLACCEIRRKLMHPSALLLCLGQFEEISVHVNTSCQPSPGGFFSENTDGVNNAVDRHFGALCSASG